MQQLQRSYAITEERIETMLSKGSLSSLYDKAKVAEMENSEELTGKKIKKLIDSSENTKHTELQEYIRIMQMRQNRRISNLLKSW